MKISYGAVLPLPPEVAFEFVADPVNWPLFVPSVRSVHKDADWGQVGGHAHLTSVLFGRSVTMDLELTEWDPPRSFRYTVSQGGKPGNDDNRRMFEPVAGGLQVTARAVCRPTRTTDPPSRAGKRKIGLPPQLVQLLIDHHREQDQERARAGPLWVETGRVFTDKFGRAVKPNSDYHAWKALLKRAGVRESRLHDARHTAATVLLALEVPERTVMGVMGWSSTCVSARYQHVTDPIRHEVASRVGGLLWSPAETN